MPTLEVTGAYCGVETLKSALPTTPFSNANLDALFLDHLNAASRDLERETLRHFFPITGVNKYRWPPLHVAASWEIWTEDDLLSVTSLQVQASGVNAVPVTLTHFFLEPQPYGPPYNRIEIDLSSSDVFQAGPTPQQSVAITGQWGYTNATVAAGTLNGTITAGATTLVCSDGTLIDQGDVLLIDSEAIAVTAPRTFANVANATLTVIRGVNGTTAAAHSNSAPIVRYRAPADVRRLVRSDAITMFMEDYTAWSRLNTVVQAEVMKRQILSMNHRQQIVDHYARRRFAAV